MILQIRKDVFKEIESGETRQIKLPRTTFNEDRYCCMGVLDKIIVPADKSAEITLKNGYSKSSPMLKATITANIDENNIILNIEGVENGQ